MTEAQIPDVLIPVGITLLLLFAAAGLGRRGLSDNVTTIATSRDLTLSLLFRLRDSRRWSWLGRLVTDSPLACGSVLWMSISFALGVLPFLLWHGESLLTQEGIMVSLNFTFVVPVLFGSYLYLSRAAAMLFAPNSLMRFGVVGAEEEAKAFTKRAFGHAHSGIVRWAVVTVTAAILAAAVLSMLKYGNTTMALVVNDNSSLRLTGMGYAYYVLRGLDAYLALNLFVLTLILVKAIHLDIGGGVTDRETHLLSEQLQPRQEICRVCSALVMCLMFASLVTAVHGVPMLLDALREQRPEILFTSTWGVFTLLTIIGAFLVGACIYRFYTLLEKEKARIIDRLVLQTSGEDGDVGDDYVEKYSRIMDFARRVRTMPLVGMGKVSIVALAVCQLLNVATAAVGLFRLMRLG